MEQQSIILMVTAASIGFFHTLLGPDHYIPFIAMSKAGKWSRTKTIWITAASGLGHVLSSVVLGLLGITVGIALNKLDIIESFRADLAAWLIISFGLIYFIWGIKLAYHHTHHHSTVKAERMTPWVIFTIFVLGPCEPLIPLLIYPAVMENVFTLVMVIIIFTSVTSVTMVAIVWGGLYGLNFFPSHLFERYAHAAAGIMILFCGLSIKLLGL
jgi:nickel/cobalt transporter (NicO) family protein